MQRTNAVKSQCKCTISSVGCFQLFMAYERQNVGWAITRSTVDETMFSCSQCRLSVRVVSETRLCRWPIALSVRPEWYISSKASEILSSASHDESVVYLNQITEHTSVPLSVGSSCIIYTNSPVLFRLALAYFVRLSSTLSTATGCPRTLPNATTSWTASPL